MSLSSLIIKASKLFNRRLYATVETYCRGDVLDIGGHHFFYDMIEQRPALAYNTWTTLEPDPDRLPSEAPELRFSVVQGDGQNLSMPDESFETVLNIQVIEHVPHPERLIAEVKRVLKPGGHAVLLIPQTTAAHAIPHFYCNFSKYWIRMATREAGLDIVEETPLGGLWRTIAYRYINFFLMALRVQGFSSPEEKRSLLFHILLPFSVTFALFSIPMTLIFSLADLTEDANNHLVVVRKPVLPGTQAS